MKRRERPPKKVASTPSTTPTMEEEEPQSENETPSNMESIDRNMEDQEGKQKPHERNKATKTLESQKGESEPRKLWVDVISGNRNPGNGMEMEFIALKIIDGIIEVEIEEADIENEIKFWDTALIMYVLRGDLSMHVVKQFMMRNWNFVKLPDMYYNDEGYFVLRFHSHKDRDVELQKGPYTIRNMPMLLTEWKPDFNLKKICCELSPYGSNYLNCHYTYGVQRA